MSESLSVALSVAAAGFAAGSLLLADRRRRAAAMLLALALATVVIGGQAWDGPLADLRASAARAVAVLVGGPAVLGGLALAFRRWPALMPLALVAALPFRVPVDAGGETSNLLLPLYAVTGGGAIAFAIAARGDRGGPARAQDRVGARWLRIALAAVVVVYALQAVYSSDVPRAVQNVGFFLVPFAVLFGLLLQVRWDRRLLVAALGIVLVEGAVFAAVGIGQQIVGEIFWNSRLIQANEFDFYLRANSLFWDPNIYGRYLALTALVAIACLLWARQSRIAAGLAATCALLWLGLAASFSQTSFVALLCGLALLAALRWSLRWTLAPLALIVVAVAAFLLASGSIYETTSGRSDLAREGLELATDRPLGGHGSGSFSVAFSERNDVVEGESTISHTEQITVAAEQGAVGLLAYGNLLAASIVLLFAGMRARAPGLGGDADPRRREVNPILVARIALAVAFVGMVVDSVGYAAFFTDPLTWVLLAVGAALAAPVVDAGADRPSG